MIKAYPEVENVFDNIPERSFVDEKEAIEYFKAAYGDKLQAVINEETVKIIWSKTRNEK